MTNEFIESFEESIDAGEAALLSEGIGPQTTLIDFLTVAAAVLIAVAVVFIVIRIKRKSHGQG